MQLIELIFKKLFQLIENQFFFTELIEFCTEKKENETDVCEKKLFFFLLK